MNILKIFILDDNDKLNSPILEHYLSLNPDNKVQIYYDSTTLLKDLKQKPDIVCLSDIYKGEQLLKKIKTKLPESFVIFISEQKDIETVVKLVKNGVYDFIDSNADNVKEKLWETVNRIRNKDEKVIEYKNLYNNIESTPKSRKNSKNKNTKYL